MNKKAAIIAIVLASLLGLTGFAVYKVMSQPKAPAVVENEDDDMIDDSLPENTSIEVLVEKSSAKDNTLVMTVKKLEKKYTGIAYEVTYETKGTYQGVNSGSKPLDVTGQEEYEKEVYLGTCSKNVCTPHPGVTSVSIALELTDSEGNKSQFSKDYPFE